MANTPKRTSSKHELAENAVRLARIGDLDAAAAAFEEAIALDRRNLDLAFNLAFVEQQRGDIDRAAALLSMVLQHKPLYPNAASRLSRLLARFQLSDPAMLHPAGLRAALDAGGVAHQPIVEATLGWLLATDTVLGQAVDEIGRGATERDIGQGLIGARTAEGLAAGLLHRCLAKGIVKHAGLERLLTGVRSALLLDCAADRFDERALSDLALALVVQGWNNDHAWAETAAEADALSSLAVDRQALLIGDREATRRFVCAALYRPLDAIVSPPLSLAETRRLKPRSLRELIEPQVQAAARQREAAAHITALKPLADETSLRVAGQYEAAPYPRWQSLQVSAPGALTRLIKERFADGAPAWLDQPFDVLIAGCGTGQQALQSATAYGPDARLVALDLSRASLGYASDMAQRHKISNVQFLQGDILDAPLLDRSFDIIECVGVLHHMADWRAGWLALLQRLKPTGLMYVGLYSAVSRRNLRDLRAEPDYPGPGCSNAQARAYRRQLLLRDDQAAGGDLKASRDFYALNAFRDLVLHESEAHLTLEEIGQFLGQNGLDFRGFTLEAGVLDQFATAFPASSGQGRLEDWAAFERSNPRTFDAMYRFWVGRRT